MTERAHARDREVRKSASLETLGILEDIEGTPRAELPAAVPESFAPSEPDRNGLGEPIGIREVAQLIGCSVWTVRQQCMRQGLPHFRASPGGKLIFYRTQVVR